MIWYIVCTSYRRFTEFDQISSVVVPIDGATWIDPNKTFKMLQLLLFIPVARIHNCIFVL
jgi:hypothetical protein